MVYQEGRSADAEKGKTEDLKPLPTKEKGQGVRDARGGVQTNFGQRGTNHRKPPKISLPSKNKRRIKKKRYGGIFMALWGGQQPPYPMTSKNCSDA